MNCLFEISSEGLLWIENYLTERLKIYLRIEVSKNNYIIHVLENNRKILVPICHFFYQNRLPVPFCSWHNNYKYIKPPIKETLPMPGLEEPPKNLICLETNTFNYDIVGLIYWNLARIEEINSKDLDEHDRFDPKYSHGFKHNYLRRPHLDEWIEVFYQFIIRANNLPNNKREKFEIEVSHDIDSVFKYKFENGEKILKQSIGDLIKRKDPINFLCRPINWLLVKIGFIKYDPFNTFNFIYKISEELNLTNTFYFIAGKSSFDKEGRYEINNRHVKKILREIHQKGHFIGLHPSYNTYNNQFSFEKELMMLRNLLTELKIDQELIGARMHYLRWKHPDSLRISDIIGLHHSSTMGYAQFPGFRAGTCFPYKGFDAVLQKKLNIIIRPLVFMDVTGLSKKYLNLEYSEIITITNYLKSNCRKVGGRFSILWHNSELDSKEKRELYYQILKT